MDNGAMSFTESAEVPKEGSEPIKLSDEERIADLIAKDAESKYGDRQGYLAISYGAGYLAGANAERERLNKLFNLNYVAEQLKEERNKAIQWCINSVNNISDKETLLKKLESLKSDSK